MEYKEIICPEILISAYRQGYFPMAEEDTGKIYWHSPDPRAIIPLDQIQVPKSLKKFLKKTPIDFRIDSNFDYIIKKCADRDETWISDEPGSDERRERSAL